MTRLLAPTACVAIGSACLWACGCATSTKDEEIASLRKTIALAARRSETISKVNHELQLAARERLETIMFCQCLLALAPEHRDRLHLHRLKLLGEKPWGADEMARADLAAGHLNILTGGLNIYRNGLKEIIRDDYGVTVIEVATCTTGRQAFEVIDAYNAVTKKVVEGRHGKDWLEKARRKAAAGAENEEAK